MKMGKRQLILGLSVLATLTAALLAPGENDNGVALSGRSLKAVHKTSQSGEKETAPRVPGKSAHVLSIRSRDIDGNEESAGIFESTRWTPPPEKSKPVTHAVNVQPVAPQAPPLPFKVLGLYVEGNQTAVFLQHNDQNLVVRVGDTIVDKYKVESLSGRTLTLSYLPLNQQQTLDVGSVN